MALLALTFASELSGVLQAMRVPGDEGHAPSATSPMAVSEATATWDRWWECTTLLDSQVDSPLGCPSGSAGSVSSTPAQTSPYTQPRTVLWWLLAVDTVLIGALAVLGWAAVNKVRDRTEVRQAADGTDRSRIGRILLILWFGALGTGLIENLSLGLTAQGQANLEGLYRGAFWIKLLLGGAFLVPMAVLVVARLRIRGVSFRSLALGLSLVRVPVLAVLLTALILFGPVGEQAADVMRRVDWIQLLVLLAVVVVLAVFVWNTGLTTTSRLLGGRDRPRGIQVTARYSLSADALRIGGLVLVVVLGLLALGYFPTLRGLLVPAGLVVVSWAALWLLGRLVDATGLVKPGARAIDQPRPRAASYRTPRLLSVGALLLVSLSMVRAVAGEFALDAQHAYWPWSLVALAAPTVVTGIVLLPRLSRFRRQAGGWFGTQRHWFLVPFAGLAVIAFIVAFLVGEPPELGDSLPAGQLLAAGVLATALAPGYYYLLASMTPRFLSSSNPRQALTARFQSADFWARNLLRLVGVAILLWIWLSSLRAPSVIGGVSVALLFVWALSGLINVLSLYAEYSKPPALLSRWGIGRLPVLLGLASWLVVMSVWRVPGFNDEHVVGRFGDAPAADGARRAAGPDTWLTGDDFLADWQARVEGLYDLESLQTAGELRPAVPMVFISSWGGGIRAAVWTAGVLDCAFERAREPCRDGPEANGSMFGTVLGASGISGGSLGLAAYAGYLADRREVDDYLTSFNESDGAASGDAPEHGWVELLLGDDYVSPTLARLFFTDIPMILLGGSADVPDRADTLRQSWESSWTQSVGSGRGIERGLGELWAGAAGAPPRPGVELPPIVFNSASVNDRCAINVSAARLGAGDCRSLQSLEQVDPSELSVRMANVHDVVDYLCEGEDLTLATAALMSARFPVVSPPGRLTAGACGLEPQPRTLYTIDGGSADLSATRTALQLWELVDDEVAEHNNDPDSNYCIAPVWIHLENGFAPDTPPDPDPGEPPGQFLGPARFILGLADPVATGNRQVLAREFSEPMAGGRPRLVSSDGAVPNGGTLTDIPRIAYVRTIAQPGPSAPLGWTLSATTFDDLLEDQLTRNRGQFDLIDRWLGGDLHCAPAGD